MSNVPVVVLAAGGSSRLGQPKQLLVHRGVSLVRRAANVAIESGCGPVLVMAGAEAEKVRAALGGLAVELHEHSRWRDGIGGTIAAAATEVPRRWPDATALILMGVDQPAVTASHLRELAASLDAGAKAAASSYGDTIGIPALFSRELFLVLTRLSGDSGAKIILQNAAAVLVPLPGGEVDIDQPVDLKHLE